MVQMTNFGISWPEMEAMNSQIDVKAEIEDDLDEQFGPSMKRSRIVPSTPSLQQFGAGIPFNESGLLGLRLRKSPSLLDLIQMKLSQEVTKKQSRIMNIADEKDRDNMIASAPLMAEKMKASNFPASLLKIGTWEYASTYEGDLVAKCYFAKHKIVWEVLEGGLKSKIEIQWSDIKAIKGVCPEDGPGTLEIVLARPPQFFRETNPQPRKHTLWQATSDFTNGQASTFRRHFLQCPQGSLDKHFEKLVQCDPRLYALSQQPDISLENPYFSVFEGRNEPEAHSRNHINGSYGSVVPAFQDIPLAYAGPLVSRADFRDSSQVVPTHSYSSVPVPRFNVHNSAKGAIESRIWDQLRDPILQPSIPVSALLNNIGSYISDRFSTGNAGVNGDPGQSSGAWDEIAQNLLSDSQTYVSDERSVLAKVNSFCTLLQHESLNVENKNGHFGIGNSLIASEKQIPTGEGGPVDVNGAMSIAAISRKDSFGELLMHLPRIASLPTFLPDISEELGN